LQRNEHVLTAETEHGLTIHTTQVHSDLLVLDTDNTGEWIFSV
jgi:hypothetical protein